MQVGIAVRIVVRMVVRMVVGMVVRMVVGIVVRSGVGDAVGQDGEVATLDTEGVQLSLTAGDGKRWNVRQPL